MTLDLRIWCGKSIVNILSFLFFPFPKSIYWIFAHAIGTDKLSDYSYIGNANLIHSRLGPTQISPVCRNVSRLKVVENIGYEPSDV